MAMDYTISSIDRALRMLEALSDLPGSGVTELAERTGCTKSQTFRILYTLEARGFVTKDADRSYRLGFKTMLLGDQGRRQSPLIAAAGPYVNELYQRFEENVLVVVRHDLQSACILQRSSRDQDKIFADHGRTGPLHAGGGSKILLAFAPAAVQEDVLGGELPGYTDNTTREPAKLRSLLDKIRQDGWTISDGELDHDKRSVAAPVRDASGVVVAALSVTGSADRMKGEILGEIREAVVNTAGRLSVALGYRGVPVMAS